MPLHHTKCLCGLAVLLTWAAAAVAQNNPAPRGSLDAMTVIPTAPAAATMPAAHPTTAPAIPGHPVGMQTITTGALRVLVTQGTKDGPPIGADPVIVELFAKGKVIKSYTTTIGDKGVVELHDLPLDVPFQPVITVTHSGAPQEIVGPAMHAMQPAVEMDMKIYEVTATKPAWTIGIRQIDAQAVTIAGGGVGLRLTELMGGFNPTDRAWSGEAGDDPHIFTIPLTPGAADVLFGSGMAEAGAKFENGLITRGKSMLPGSSEYIFAYVAPVKDGKATLTFTAPADTTLFALYVPAGSKVEKATGVEVAKASGTHAEAGSQLLKAKTVKSGDVATIVLSGIKVPPPPATLPQGTQMPSGHPAGISKPEPKP